MPAELTSVEEFVEIAKRASKCLVKRHGDVIKLKLRTKKRLYTYKTSPSEAERLISGLNIEIEEY
ncbi:MAG: hypothetical protein ACFFCQ_14700 [Promethearchaeota archaeon]